MTQDPYEVQAEGLAAGWDAVAFTSAHAEALPFIPKRPGLVLDVGAGSGRDAGWFAAQGWDVVAIEPSSALREHATTHHPSARIRLENDRLPGLERTLRLGLVFDLVWLSAVWMHVAPDDRPRAFRKLATLLKPGGRIIATLRKGPAPAGRPMYEVDAAELESLAVEHGLVVRSMATSQDRMGRAAVAWQLVVLELPDDGTGALPTIRGIVLQEQKSATYKLALLRVIARIADQSAAMARVGDAHIELPLGLVALYWLRMFKPLLAADLPQAPGHRGLTGLGFVKDAYAAILEVPPFELRPGATFAPPLSGWVVRALGDAAATIVKMPAYYLTYHDGRPIFPSSYAGRPSAGQRITLTADLLWQFGRTSVPLPLWTTLRRLAAWIEPMLLAEWTRLMEGYADRQGRRLELDSIARALRWIDPARDTLTVRRVLGEMLDAGRAVHCVWTGTKLTDVASIEVDHCFPFSAWPCDDLWNLMPASHIANRQKRDRLVTAGLLQRSEDRIASWWRSAYLAAGDDARTTRFAEEVRATLPLESGSGLHAPASNGLAEFARPWQTRDGIDEAAVFAAVRYQRLRLRQDQNLDEWDGPRLRRSG